MTKQTFKDLIEECPNLKAVIVHGKEPFKFVVGNGKWVPENRIVNKTKQNGAIKTDGLTYKHTCQSSRDPS